MKLAIRSASRVGAALLGAVLASAATHAAQPATPAPPAPPGAAPTVAPTTLQPFTAVFTVDWKGVNAGTASLELVQQSPGRWRYTSRNHARGLFRLAFPDDITQVSDFTLNGDPRPLRYRGDDGGTDSDRDVRLDFDWSTGRVTGVAEQKKVDLEIRPGLQDPMTIQIAIMVDLAAGRRPSTYWMVDKWKIKDYEYRSEGAARLRTAAGELDTVIWSSRRPGSDRLTRVWYAPALGFTPVRAERTRGGKTEVTMTLRSLAR